MDEESYRTVSRGSGRPLDMRIMPRILYVVGSLAVLHGILLCSGVVKPVASYRVLLGTVALDSGLTQGVHWLLGGLCYLLFDWGLRRGMKLVWCFAMVFSLYSLIRVALMVARYPVVVTIGTVFQVAFIAWLWFRRGLCGIRLRTGAH